MSDTAPFDKNVPPIHLRRGLYEFTPEMGMSAFAWVRSDGSVHPLDENVDVAEFWKAYASRVVWRLGRVEVHMYSPDAPWVECPDPKHSYTGAYISSFREVVIEPESVEATVDE